MTLATSQAYPAHCRRSGWTIHLSPACADWLVAQGTARGDGCAFPRLNIVERANLFAGGRDFAGSVIAPIPPLPLFRCTARSDRPGRHRVRQRRSGVSADLLHRSIHRAIIPIRSGRT